MQDNSNSNAYQSNSKDKSDVYIKGDSKDSSKDSSVDKSLDANKDLNLNNKDKAGPSSCAAKRKRAYRS